MTFKGIAFQVLKTYSFFMCFASKEGILYRVDTFLRKMTFSGGICNNFEKNRAFYDKSMKLGTWLVDNNTKKLRVSAMLKMSSYGHHLVFLKWPPFSLYSL